MSGSERRRAERFPVKIPIEYQAGEGDFLYENTRNFSEGGLFIATNSPEPYGDVLDLRFRVPGDDRLIEIQGRVVWRNVSTDGEEHPNPGMGLQFINLSDEDKDMIQLIVGAIAYL